MTTLAVLLATRTALLAVLRAYPGVDLPVTRRMLAQTERAIEQAEPGALPWLVGAGRREVTP